MNIFTEKIQNLTLENIGFVYPNLTTYEKQYMNIVKDFVKHGKTGSKWIDDAFDDIIKGIEEDMDKDMPEILRRISLRFEVGKIYGIV